VTEPDRPAPVDPSELGFERIVYEKTPPRATITLNRPEVLNAFDFRMLRELARACEDASWDDSIRVVVLTGAGRAFCVGADLKSWSEGYLGNPGEYWKWFGAFKDAHDRLREIGKPTLARINGIFGWAGHEFQIACDLSFLVEDPFIRRGFGSRPFDGEGLSCVKRNLIDKGVLTGWILDLRSARQLGLQPTGQGSRGGPFGSHVAPPGGASSYTSTIPSARVSVPPNTMPLTTNHVLLALPPTAASASVLRSLRSEGVSVSPGTDGIGVLGNATLETKTTIQAITVISTVPCAKEVPTAFAASRPEYT